MFGFTPICTRPCKMNFIIPIVMFLFHIICILCKIYCLMFLKEWTMKNGLMNQILLCLDAILMIAVFTVTSERTMRHTGSWKMLLELVDFHSTNKRKLQMVFLLFINFSYLFRLSLEWYNRNTNSLLFCTVSWFYLHTSHYFVNMLLFFIIQFLITLNTFYTQIYKIIIDIHTKFSEKIGESRLNILNVSIIKRIRQDSFRFFFLTRCQNALFGLPLCILIMYNLNIVLNDVQFVFEDVMELKSMYCSANVLQIILQVVSKI